MVAEMRPWRARRRISPERWLAQARSTFDGEGGEGRGVVVLC